MDNFEDVLDSLPEDENQTFPPLRIGEGLFFSYQELPWGRIIWRFDDADELQDAQQKVYKLLRFMRFNDFEKRKLAQALEISVVQLNHIFHHREAITRDIIIKVEEYFGFQLNSPRK